MNDRINVFTSDAAKHLYILFIRAQDEANAENRGEAAVMFGRASTGARMEAYAQLVISGRADAAKLMSAAADGEL